MKKAILIGASGFIGGYLLEELLNNPVYGEVTIVVRKPLNLQHPKLKMLIGDYHTIEQLREYLVADDIFIALGTTKAKTPDEKLYYQIDHDYPVLAAKLAKAAGATSVLIVTAVGANERSGMFYIRTKGEVERDIIALGFKHTHIFRPSMILGNRAENRPLETVLINVFRAINPVFVGGMSKYRGIEGQDIAKSMIAGAQRGSQPVEVYHWKEMTHLLK